MEVVRRGEGSKGVWRLSLGERVVIAEQDVKVGAGRSTVKRP